MRAFYKILSFSLLVLITQTSIAQSTSSQTRYVFAPDSTLFIDGTSTIHDWTCDINKSSGAFVAGFQAASATLKFESGSFTVEIEDIDCGKGSMNKKMRNALGGNKATNMTFKLASATTTSTADRTFSALLKGTLTMAGVTKPIDLSTSGKLLANNQVQLEGSVALVMSDFSIDPPTALLGTLHTGDKVTIRFNVVAHPE